MIGLIILVVVLASGLMWFYGESLVQRGSEYLVQRGSEYLVQRGSEYMSHDPAGRFVVSPDNAASTGRVEHLYDTATLEFTADGFKPESEPFVSRSGGSVVIDAIDMPVNYAPYIRPNALPQSIEALMPRPVFDGVDRSALVTQVAIQPAEVTMWYANWCGACKIMKPVFARVKADFAAAKSPIVWREYDSDKTAPPPSVTGFPTIFVRDIRGALWTYPGGADYVKLRNFILARTM